MLAIESLRGIYQKIKKNAFLHAQDEVVKLIDKLEFSLESQDGEPSDEVSHRRLEAELRETIFAVHKFLGWYPEEESSLSPTERELLQFFDNLLYSRKARMDIVHDTCGQGPAKIFADNLQFVVAQIQKAKERFAALQREHRGLLNKRVDLAVPRQNEDYFPLHGVIRHVETIETAVGDIIEIEILEDNEIASSVVFTGRNIRVVL